MIKLNISFAKNLTKFIKKHITINDNYKSRKYKEYTYVEEIIKFINNGVYWRRHCGKISGRVLNNKHNEYVKSGIYDAFYC